MNQAGCFFIDPDTTNKPRATIGSPGCRAYSQHASSIRYAFIKRLLAAFALAAWGTTGLAAESDKAKIDFNRQIRPILSNHCFKCHGPDAAERQAGLRLDLREAATAALESAATAIVPGNPDESEIVIRIMANDDSRMPPPETKKQLSAEEQDLLIRWIKEGATYARHWAFITPARPEPPQADEASVKNPIDRFVLARLNREGLAASPEADRPALIRRLTLDLTGLPPTLAEVDAFLNDERPDAYERLVDRLLASPHFGERLALEWLDAARYADTHGYHIDSGRDMTRWREWVIEAFNQNMPFDRFTVEQLAGDLLPNPTTDQLVASGFNRNHMINFEGGAIPEEYLNNYIVDRVNTTAMVWLGLTLNCTQCHDHKYDPFTQRDFYRLYAFFHNVPENGLDGSKGNAAPLISTPTLKQQQEIARLEATREELHKRLADPWPEADAEQAAWEESAADPRAVEQLPAAVRDALTLPGEGRSDEQIASLRDYFRSAVSSQAKPVRDHLAEVDKSLAEARKKTRTTMVMREMEKPRETFVLVRGQYDKKGEPVAAGVPENLASLPDGAPSNRLGLAKWLVDRSHPLTARVIVNRYWQMLFGVGLVKTSEDFGSQGERPSHPELLDFLASEFMDSGWNVKHMIRLMTTSAAYRQSSAVAPASYARDPENRLLARGPRFRLPAEFIRDLALATSGLLNDEIGGASVSPYQPPGLWEELASREDGANWTAQTYSPSHGADLYRRTMYAFWKRTSPPPTLSAFDAPDREMCIVRRTRTNTPLQALILLNDPTYVEAARKLAERIMIEASDVEGRITLAFRLATARRPKKEELAVLTEIFTSRREAFRQDKEAAERLLGVGESPRKQELEPSELAAWTIVASTILNLDETITKN